MALPWRSGHFITANRLNSALGSSVGRVMTQASVAYTTSGTTELHIAKLAIEDLPIFAGRWYAFDVSIECNNSVAADQFTVRVRKDTSSGTEVGNSRFEAHPTNNGITSNWFFREYWKAPADDADGDFYITIQRILGTGTSAVQGYSHTSFAITDIGSLATFVEVP